MTAALVLVSIFFARSKSPILEFPPLRLASSSGFVLTPCACGVNFLCSNLRALSLWLVPLCMPLGSHAVGDRCVT